MPVTKRTRYEVLRRDNHTCRYCGACAPDAKLTVDHVTPTALGGTDDPGNLVAACRDCNYGKASTSPDASLVEDVKAIDLKWARVIARAARARAGQRKKRDAYVAQFTDTWTTYKSRGETLPLPVNWEASIWRFYETGLPIADLLDCAKIAGSNTSVYSDDRFRYFAGCAWRAVTEMQEAAKALLTLEEN
jgi:hypothetical protein